MRPEVRNSNAQPRLATPEERRLLLRAERTINQSNDTTAPTRRQIRKMNNACSDTGTARDATWTDMGIGTEEFNAYGSSWLPTSKTCPAVV